MTRRDRLDRGTLANDAGFTLIELLVVVGVIGVIGAIAIPSLMRARINADEASAIATLRAVKAGF